jgi:hypothetical protein
VSGFSCTPSLVPPPGQPAADPIANDGWFPAIDPAVLREERRIRDAVTADRLRAAVLEAMIWTNDQLAEWRTAQTADSFEDVPSPPLAGETRNLVLYRTAVGAWTKALLVERQRDTDLTGAGQRKVEELDESIGELRRDALHAVRGILGRTRTCVELI